MKKHIFSLMVACLSLVSSLMTIQAAAQDNLTESQVRSIVENTLESKIKSADQTSPASSLFGPRFEIVRMPDRDFTVFKFDKETGDTWEINTYKETGNTWEINTYKSTKSRLIGRLPGGLDEVRPGEVNYQLIITSWHHILLLNVHTGTMWESRLTSGKNAHFEDFKEVGMGES